jgi:hypothetical protein
MSTDNSNLQNIKPGIGSEIGTGILNTLGGLFGIGPIPTAASQLQDATTKASSSLADSYNILTLMSFKALETQQDVNKNTYNLINANKDNLQKTIEYYNTISNYNYYESNLFIKILSIIVFIIIIFMLVK